MSEDRKLAGSLDALSLPGLVQLLSSERRTGRVDVSGPRGAGSLWLDTGDLVHASVHSGDEHLEGEAAIDDLLGLGEGTFVFAPGEAAPVRTLSGPTDHLLMEAAVRRDHARRGPGAVLPGHAVPSFAPLPASSTARYTTMQWRVLAAIDGRKDIATIAAEVQLPVGALSAVLTELEAVGVIHIA